MKNLNHTGMAAACGLVFLIGAMMVLRGVIEDPRGYLFALNESIAAEAGIVTVPGVPTIR